MKKYVIPGPTPDETVQKLAKKHGVPVAKIQSELEMGIPVEQEEHRGDLAASRTIALAHLKERPDYYSRLKEMEDSKIEKSSMKETMHEFKQGTLRSGSGKKVTSRDQAIAIGMNESRGRIKKADTGVTDADASTTDFAPDYYIRKSAKYGYNAEGYALQGRRIFSGLSIAIENQKGSVRKWYDSMKNETGSTRMHYDYGYIEGLTGADKEEVDVYVGPKEASPFIFVVHQNNPETGEYDEDKMMLGFDTAEEAKRAYLQQYNDPNFFGWMDRLELEDFKQKYLNNDDYPSELPIQKAQVDHRTEGGEALEGERHYAIPLRQRYQKGQILNIQGVEIKVVSSRGTYKTLYDYAAQEFKPLFLTADYGHIHELESTAGECLEVLLGLNPANGNVWIFHVHHPATEEYLMDILVLGCDSLESAIRQFCNRYPARGSLGSAEYTGLAEWKRVYYQALPKSLAGPMSGEFHYTKQYLVEVLQSMDPSDSKLYQVEGE